MSLGCIGAVSIINPKQILLNNSYEIEKLSARYPTYGYRRITQLLKRLGYAVGSTRVARLMKEQNLSVAIKRACQTTQSVAGLGQWVNRVQNLDICRRNQVWVGDITYMSDSRNNSSMLRC